MHLTDFGKRLDDKQICIKRFGINISNEDKLQFYLEQMYSCNQFDQTQITAWESKTKAIKTNWTETKQYFEGLVRDFEIYEQNSSGTMGIGKYKSANQATKAAKGNKLRHYIATIAAAAVAKDDKQDMITANICNTAQKKTGKMVMQLKLLSNAVATLTITLATRKNNGGGNVGSGGSSGSGSTGSSSGKKPWKKSRCMGGYCWSHGYHTSGDNHMSATCMY
jgi:hypothetical protein